MNLILATGNPGKLKEIEGIFREKSDLSGFHLSTIASLPEKIRNAYNPVEDGISFLENAHKKAHALYSLLEEEEKNFCIIAEDSGLEVEALNYAPGIYSSRYGEDDPGRISRLLRELEGLEAKDRKARFVTVAAAMDKDGNVVYFTGKVEGRIAMEPAGENGFGYDPVFFHEPSGKTFAEMTKEEKNHISHRHAAFEKLILYLNRWSVRLKK